MFRRDRSVPEDRSVCQESWAHSGLCVPPAKHHEDQPGPGSSVRSDARPR